MPQLVLETVATITLVLTSSVVSAALTGIITLRVNAANYKREYYKKLLDRRLDAYERLELLFQALKLIIRLDDNRICHSACTQGADGWTHFVGLTVVAGSRAFWLSDETSSLVTELAMFNSSFERRALKHSEYVIGLQEQGVLELEEFRRFGERLEKLMYRDLKTLSEVSSFVSRKRTLKEFAFKD